MDYYSMFTSFNDTEMEDLSFMDHLQIDSSLTEIFGPPPPFLPDIISEDIEQETKIEQAISCKIHAQVDHHTIIAEEKPFKHLETNIWNNKKKINNNHALISQDASNSIMLSFDNDNNPTNFSQNLILNDHPQVVTKKISTAAFATPASQQAKDHILAERKRREKLNQRFIALSTIIPGLKKMDKATVLGDAYKYVKQLEEQVKTLEEVTRSKTIESAMLVNRSRLSEHDDDHYNCSSMMDDVCYGGSIVGGQFPEIEAKFSNKDVLIRIHCQKRNNRVIEKLISQIENLHLVVTNSSALAFGCSSLDATIIAKMRDEFSLTTKDLVIHLHDALKRLM